MAIRQEISDWFEPGKSPVLSPEQPMHISGIPISHKHSISRDGDPNNYRNKWMIEINWGHPMTLVTSPQGAVQEFETIEQVRYWLRKKWPVADKSRDLALNKIDAAMDCMGTVAAARKAFLSAAQAAGFRQQD